MSAFFLARWYRWLVSPRPVDTRGRSSTLQGSNANDTAVANPPTYIAYHVKETTAGEQGEKRGVWTRVGAAWPNKDGKGFNVVLDVVPLDGRLILREPLEREHAGGMQPSEMR
jgi:hypothetical protein